MKPSKKAKGPLISKARARETRHRLSLSERVAKAERALNDAEAVVIAAKRFWQQSREALKTAAGVSARERAEAMLDATAQFAAECIADASIAKGEYYAARDALFTDNDRRLAQAEEDPGLHKKVLARMRERPHALEIDIDDLSAEASAADLTFLDRWSEAYRALGKKKK
jgi:hypothetical protein